MKAIIASAALAMTIGSGLALASGTAHAANWERPYQNVNRSIDAGNPTGDRETARLNEQSLQRAQGSTANNDTSGLGAGSSGMPGGSSMNGMSGGSSGMMNNSMGAGSMGSSGTMGSSTMGSSGAMGSDNSMGSSRSMGTSGMSR